MNDRAKPADAALLREVAEGIVEDGYNFAFDAASRLKALAELMEARERRPALAEDEGAADELYEAINSWGDPDGLRREFVPRVLGALDEYLARREMAVPGTRNPVLSGISQVPWLKCSACGAKIPKGERVFWPEGGAGPVYHWACYGGPQ